MTLIVEDGTGLANAESYSSVVFADNYHSLRGNNAWDVLNVNVKEQHLRNATDYMLNVYRDKWKGVRNTGVQALCFPRSYAYLDLVADGNNELPNTVVPIHIQNACADLALKSSVDSSADSLGLLSDITNEQQVLKEKVDGAVAVEYSEAMVKKTQYSSIDSMLSMYLEAGVTGGGRLLTSTVQRG